MKDYKQIIVDFNVYCKIPMKSSSKIIMKNSRDKIKFNFLFRDEGNYKIFSYEILNNSNNLDVFDIEKKYDQSLLIRSFFILKNYLIEINIMENSVSMSNSDLTC